MKNLIESNTKAWNYGAYDFFIQNEGTPKELSQKIIENPNYFIRRFDKDLGNVKGKKILCPLGSYGRKAFALAVLGAEVTLVDISTENKRYCDEMCQSSDHKVDFIVSDFLSYKGEKDFYDIVFLEGGILHYFEDLNIFAKHIKRFLLPGGKLILNDFHPMRKLFKERDIFIEKKGSLIIDGDYFETENHEAAVSYERFADEEDKKNFPKCVLKYPTLSDIINAFASNDMMIERFDEMPRYDEHQHVPGNFTLIVRKK